jgi:hypothetical protein
MMRRVHEVSKDENEWATAKAFSSHSSLYCSYDRSLLDRLFKTGPLNAILLVLSLPDPGVGFQA